MGIYRLGVRGGPFLFKRITLSGRRSTHPGSNGIIKGGKSHEYSVMTSSGTHDVISTLDPL